MWPGRRTGTRWSFPIESPHSRSLLAFFLVSIETGEKRRLTSPPATLIGDISPQFSPDGHTLAFTREVDHGNGDLYLLSLSDVLKPLSEPRRLTSGNWGVNPAWTVHGREIVFANRTRSGLWRVAASALKGRPAEPKRLAFPSEDIYEPAIPRHGRRLAYTH